MTSVNVNQIKVILKLFFKLEQKKKKSFGRSFEVMKKLRLSTHETGSDCNCERLQYFERVNEENRKTIINNFNNLKSRNEQSLYLACLIRVHNVKKRRPTETEEEAKFFEKTYTYKVRIRSDGDQFEELPVCYKAFLS